MHFDNYVIHNIFMCTGLKDEASTFFVYLLTLMLTSIAASGVAFIVGALVNVIALANITAAFVYIFMLVRFNVCNCMYASCY